MLQTHQSAERVTVTLTMRSLIVMGKLERLFIYGLVFLFFPGMVLFAPFLNLRMNGKEES